MSNDFIQAVDNEEVDGSGQSFIQSAGEFFGYGVTSSVISGGVGIWNSVKAIGNTFGADLAMTNEADVVQNLVGQEAQDYYRLCMSQVRIWISRLRPSGQRTAVCSER